MNKKYIIVLSLFAGLYLPTTAQESNEEQTDKFVGQTIDVGAERLLTREEATGSVSVISSETTDRRSAKNIGNSIIGQGNGLISLQSGGRYADVNPTFYIRGLQTLNGKNSPLVMIDGIQRDIVSIAPEEVESVIVLKDAAAVALYGYKGINGAINIVTKRGKYNSRSVKVTYDHLFTSLANKPKFVDAYTYGLAVNEARINDGLTGRYSNQELNALRDGTMPYLYPNVNWVDETFRDNAMTNKYNIEFRGGGEKFRYYTMLDLISNKGFVKEPGANEGYSTQDKYVKGNLRMNMDINLTQTTDLQVNLLGVLQETSRPGAQADLWDLVYTVPSAAFPIRDENGIWGGSDTWAGTQNPVAQSIGAAYYKNHTRSLFADMKLTQDLSGLTKGLNAFVRISYDNIANIYEDHSKEYVYSVNAPTWADGASEPTVKSEIYGKDSEMGTDAKTNEFDRLLHFDVGFNYQRTFGDHSIYSQLKWDYENNDPNGVNNTVNRQNITWWSHYGYMNRYFVDLALVESGSSRLAPGTKWAFSPTLSAAWVISKEKFMENVEWVNFLKLRGSAGIINVDNLPGDEVWSYYAQQYGTSGGTYPFDSGWNSSFGRSYLERVATTNPSHEKAYKYNVGMDAKLFGCLDVTLDLWKEHRTNIWVTSEGKYSEIFGMEPPYENAGIVDSKGIEVGLDYSKKLGQVEFNVGGNFSLNKNEIKEMLEEPRQYANLVQTGNPYGQLYGLEAIGFFKDEADIAASPTQNFSTVKPGDIKYRDVNGDNIIDTNDEVAIGYSTTCPEIYYSLHLGAEWKGLGFYAMFQGTGNYSAVLNTKSMYWPLINNTNISQYAYDNRWIPQNQNAKFPRLSSQSNANNYQTSTLWLADRSFIKLRNLEVYYKLPASWLKKTKIVNAAKLYVRGIDLLSFDHIDENDAEAYGINPMTKSVALGLSVTF
ncbi:SusC/RagA family TonB-linked outer membrane protein [Bacteroides intestinalis]|uniref:SusC/RagA family TonB-linked outer membrane protein n=1 Tax=Bacteroides intestinalis TaxID=329854 RepID=UPI000E4E9DF5|nr:SusC/RagA family TonB-linked outer membrane protein [Bacteroides intestinalis]RGX86264.1 SusC/RagA family TonB-linked outer membrane protein [Bacteroides intestinalis]